MARAKPVAPSLLLVRHAKAEAEHPEGDDLRGLTPDGRAEFRQHAEQLASHHSLKALFTSPLVRAVQTAEILAATQGLEQVEIREELAPRWRATSRILELCLEVPSGAALVGHNPALSEVAAELLGLGELPFKFRKGGVLALRRQGKSFAFLWFSAPGAEWLKSLPD